MNDDNFGLAFHHLGLAVPAPEAATLFLRGLGYRGGQTVRDPLQHADLTIWRHASAPNIEVICPATPNAGPVAEILALKPEGLVYHLCYTTENLDESLDRLETAGLRPFEVSPPKPAVLFGGERVSFYLILEIGLIEIIEGRGLCFF